MPNDQLIKRLSQRLPTDPKDVPEYLRRELVPVLRQVTSCPVVDGSLAGGTALESLITALAGIGLIKDETVP